jgi:hypothetical protein
MIFQDNFGSLNGPLISLRSLALAVTLFTLLAEQVGTGCCPIPLLGFSLMKVEKERSSLLKSFFRQFLKLGSTPNPKLSARGGSDPANGGTKDCERKNPDSRSELPFRLSAELLFQSRDQSVLKELGNGLGNTDPIPLQTSLRDMRFT